MDKKNLINRSITLALPLSETAKDFGYNLEVDSYDDVYHNGYSKKDVRSMGVTLPESLEGADKLFPLAVAQAIESAERDAYAAAIRKERISAFQSALEKIDLSGGGAEYTDLDGDRVSTKAGILSTEVNEKEDTLSVTILNPEHLINSVIEGVGYIYPDLSSSEPASDSEIKGRFHNLKDYFNVYGESKPSGDLSSQFSPGIDDDFFADEVKFRIGEMSLTEVAEAVTEAVDLLDSIPKETVAQASKLTSFSSEEIKEEILKDIKEKEDFWKNELS